MGRDSLPAHPARDHSGGTHNGHAIGRASAYRHRDGPSDGPTDGHRRADRDRGRPTDRRGAARTDSDPDAAWHAPAAGTLPPGEREPGLHPVGGRVLLLIPGAFRD